MTEAPLELDPGDLVEPVRRALGVSDATIERWAAEAVHYEDFGEGFRSVHRLTGLAVGGGLHEPTPWSMVLKSIISPGDEPEPPGASRTYAYPHREAMLHASGILEETPSGFRAVRCYEALQRPNVDLLFLEDLGEAPTGPWPPDRIDLAARHLGRFGGSWLTRRPLPDSAFLADVSSIMRHWLDAPSTQPALTTLLDAGAWSAMCDRLGVPEAGRVPALRAVLADPDPWVERLEAMAPTLCHNDEMASNLFTRPVLDGSDETVAIDWQLAGRAPLGSALASLVGTSALFGRVGSDTLVETDRRALRSYCEGLDDVGAAYAARDVAATYATSVVLRVGPLVIPWLHALGETDHAWVETFWHRSPNELASQWRDLIGFLETKAIAVTAGELRPTP